MNQTVRELQSCLWGVICIFLGIAMVQLICCLLVVCVFFLLRWIPKAYEKWICMFLFQTKLSGWPEFAVCYSCLPGRRCKHQLGWKRKMNEMACILQMSLIWLWFNAVTQCDWLEEAEGSQSMPSLFSFSNFLPFLICEAQGQVFHIIPWVSFPHWVIVLMPHPWMACLSPEYWFGWEVTSCAWKCPFSGISSVLQSGLHCSQGSTTPRILCAKKAQLHQCGPNVELVLVCKEIK